MGTRGNHLRRRLAGLEVVQNVEKVLIRAVGCLLLQLEMLEPLTDGSKAENPNFGSGVVRSALPAGHIADEPVYQNKQNGKYNWKPKQNEKLQHSEGNSP